MIRRILILATVAVANTAGAATHLVDAKPGAAPFQSIQAALDQAKPGDTVRVAPGVYRERLRFKTGGTPDQPIILEGQNGAIIDASNDVKPDWQPAPDVATGTYRAKVGFFPYTITADGKIITTIDEKRTDPALPHDARDNLRWPSIFKGGTGEAGWAGLRAVALYLKKEGTLLIKFRKNLDPRTMEITLSPRDPAILITGGVGHCVIRGFTIRNAAYGVRIEGAQGVVVENCFIGPADYGVHMEAGASKCVIRHNEITMAPYSGADPWREGSWDNWQAHKNAGFYDHYAIRASETKDCEIHDNFIHDHWDGIETGWPGKPEDNGGHNIYNNVLHTIFDDGMETSGGQANNRFHNNYIENARIAIRIKNPDQGPLYIYRNIFVGNKSDMVIWSSGKSYSPAELWVYQNTCTADIGLGQNFRDGKAATANYHFFNNLFWSLSSTQKRDAGYQDPDWVSDNNVFVAVTLENPRPWFTEAANYDAENRRGKWEASLQLSARAGIEKNSVWSAAGQPGFVDVANRNLAVTKESPAFAAGRDLSKNEKPLPGCEPGYFKGEKPNAGALQDGETMPKLPVLPAFRAPGPTPVATSQ